MASEVASVAMEGAVVSGAGGWTDGERMTMLHDMTSSHEQFRREVLGDWPTRAVRCEVKSRAEQCSNEATYEIGWREKTGAVCSRCLAEWVAVLTDQGNEVIVRRLGLNGRGA